MAHLLSVPEPTPAGCISQSLVADGIWLGSAMGAGAEDRRAGGKERWSVTPFLTALYSFMSVFLIVDTQNRFHRELKDFTTQI